MGKRGRGGVETYNLVSGDRCRNVAFFFAYLELLKLEIAVAALIDEGTCPYCAPVR